MARFSIAVLAFVSALGSSPAFALAAEKVQAKVGACLTEAEIREEVAAKRVVPQVMALRAARSSAGGDAVRARLCQGEAGLVYQITALKRDGKVVRVLVDAASGRVVAEN